ncbi:MAG: sigma-54-dependent Fis family transcriptional regulator [Candidatus Margulisiibacteriota bacterium]|nr:MAG: sigma-54-dependent Fis family transcriptional regulator [Candidatus Margulisbacteria bacterium GWD2_39_127]OGI01823.1 MAG: sigma-54-dependent Fis family transcriptional regulator [Candidatus Margulisbacteria bacterium GWF2_38_17]OGI10145.1 MAG: sigma-54-dependent Fis family transcriptional regulator [Candidatus Margulisbacteria bacterium GWE2_39_32]PZM79517.1 MAG: sigma-54-dependent Fis family transcriptional regulator [Candidatus Margulisiibacteriota bacterium]HAR63810.1 sigma-54-depen
MPENEVKKLSLLFDISQVLNVSMDIKEIVKPVLSIMSNKMGMLRGTLTILDKDRGQIFIEDAIGLSDLEQKRGRYKLGEGITGKVVQTGKAALIPRISEDPLFLNRTGARNAPGKKDISFICVPIKNGDEILGALSADRLYDNGIMLEEDLHLLSIIAAMVAQSVKIRQEALKNMERLQEENSRLLEELKDKFRPANMIGNSKKIQAVFDLIQIVANSSTTIHIRGESGVGKELIAHAIHYNSNRAAQPFIKVNCAALPENLIESELFGHEKGSFTGAINTKKGRFELANGGTLFLDEIGDLPLATQVMLLRVLQEKELERVGGTNTIKVDVRLLTATNRDLEKMVEEGVFRSDLYYRLNVFPIQVPPLRERLEDIPILVNYFIDKFSKENCKKITSICESAMNMLLNYNWPGNIRELENCIERAVVLSKDDSIHSYQLPPTIKKEKETAYSKLDNTLGFVEKDLIIDALKQSKGCIAKAARLLGITERIMGLRLKKYAIDPKLI